MAELGLRTLADRRNRIDMVQTFKILNGHDNVDYEKWFRIVGHNVARITRNSTYHKNIISTRSNKEIRRNFFTNRVAATWNTLPETDKESQTVQIQGKT